MNIIHGRFKLKPCKVCGTQTKFQHCSNECKQKTQRNLYIHKLNSGLYASKSTNSIRKLLITIRGNNCESCRNSKWVYKNVAGFEICDTLPLTLHHVDGNADNNVPTNLQLVCWNCHSLTPNFGRKNKNSSRKNRYRRT